MDRIINNGHAERVPDSELNDCTKPVWYIPHHGVYHVRKPQKIRVVFDCSAKFSGQSLNDHLLQGPDLTNNLFGVLCRFRQKNVAFTCDIEQMFFQFRVPERQRNYLRILWWEHGDFQSILIEYRLKVHLFGAVSSPGCANFGLKQLANDYESEIGSEVANVLRHDFYVDDGLKSLPNVEQAVQLIQKSKEICDKGGLKLHKFVSNSTEVISSVFSENVIKDLNQDELSIERALGVQWNIQSDTFQFRIQIQDQLFTRRGVLSTVCSIYDPFGFIAPVVMIDKSILQQMCKHGAEWHDPIPDDLRSKWSKWRIELQLLEHLSVQRCYKLVNFGQIKEIEIRSFSDASNDGYGQCSYLRIVNEQNQVHCSFLMGKARVSPLKQLTIPRLELSAALVSVRVSSLLCQELEFADIKEVFWTDSKVVLGYISNDSKRFQVFVANRVSQIREHSDPSQWRFIKGERNPADEASRGLSAGELVNNSRWLKGSSFLWNSPLIPNDSEIPLILDPTDPELKKGQAFSTQVTEQSSGFELERLKHCSSWNRAKKAVALCHGLKRKWKESILDSKDGKSLDKNVNEKLFVYDNVDVNVLQQAETQIFVLFKRNIFKMNSKPCRKPQLIVC